MAPTPRLAHVALAGSAAAALAGSLLLTASPAGASPTTTTTFSAVASWTPAPGSSGPNVSLQVNEESGPTGSFLFFFLNEGSCTSDGGFSGLGYFFEGPAPEVFTVSRNLASAVLESHAIDGTLTTTTSPVCNGTDLTTVSTTVPVSAFGKWSATGPAQTTFPGNVARPANATVQLTGPSVLGFAGLGAPNFAQISSYTAP